MKRQIRLTESDLHNIIKESVKRIINEDKNNLKANFLEAKRKLGNIDTFGLDIDIRMDRNEDNYPCIIAQLSNESASFVNSQDFSQPKINNLIKKLNKNMENAGFTLVGGLLDYGTLMWYYTTDMFDMWQKRTDRYNNLNYDDNLLANKKYESYYDDKGDFHIDKF